MSINTKTNIKSELINWIKTFVEKPNPLLGDWAPCPYARKARVNNKIHIELAETHLLEAAVLDNIFWLDDTTGEWVDTNKDVIVIAFDHNEITVDELSEFVDTMNDKLFEKDIIILEDHPNAKADKVNDVVMNFGKCGLLLMQRLSKLNEASEQLKEKGYYDHWDDAALNYVVNWRPTK